MKLVIDREKIAGPLSQIAALARRTTVPILDCVKVSATEGKLSLVGTNLDIELTHSVDIEGGEDFALCVDAARLAAFVRSTDAGNVEFDLGDRNLTVRSGRSRVSLALVNVADFPAMNAPDEAVPLAVPAAGFCSLLDEAAPYAAAPKSGRFYLCGVYLHERRGCLAAAATDGNRLSLAEMTCAAEISGSLLPVETCRVLNSVFSEGDETLRVEIGEGRIRASNGQASVISRLIDADFPDYRRVIPEPVPAPIMVPAEDMTAALSRILAVVRDDEAQMKSPTAKLSFEGSVLTVSGGNQRDGVDVDSHIEVARDTAPLTIGFQARYLVQAVKTLNVPMIEFHLTDAGGPGVLRIPNDDTRLVVVMPIRI